MGFKSFKNIKELESKRIKLIKELTFGHGYSMLKSSKTIDERNEALLEFVKEYDDYGYMSQELGEELDSLFADKEYVIGIHRTGFTNMNDEMINSIFDKGLINNGHIMQGAAAGSTDIERTVSLFNNFVFFYRELKAAHNYKESQGCIIVKIPKSYLGKSDGKIKPIYYKDGTLIKLLPEFIYGYVPLYSEGKLGEIQHNPKYRDNHNLNNVNLLYEDSVIYKAKTEGIEINNQDISIDEKYQIIKKAYEDTFIKYGKYQANQALLYLINDNEVKYFTGQENKILLSKYIVYSDVLKILCISNLDLINSDRNAIINTFIENCNTNKEKNNKL